MLKMTIDNEEVLSNNDISIKEEILSPSSTILNNVYPKSWEQDKDYTSRFYYPKDYSKLNIQNFSVTPEEAGTTIQVNENATLTDVDTTKESRVLRVLGNTSQVQYTGKNLFNIYLDKNAGFSRVVQGITETYNSDGSITYTGTATAQIDLYITTNSYPSTDTIITLDTSKKYTMSLTGDTSNNIRISMGYGTTAYHCNTTYTFTPTTNISWAFVRISNGATINATIYPMLEQSNSATSYEPYVGGTASPNPSYPQNVNVVSGDNTIDICGKNLFDNNVPINNMWINQQGATTTVSGCLLEKISCVGGENYTLKLDWENAHATNNGCIIAFYDSNNILLSRNPYAVNSTTLTITRTAPNNSSYMYVGHYIAKPIKVQLEKGSTATTYEPYIGNTYPIYLGVENLLPFSVGYTETKSGITLEVKEDGIYLTGTPTISSGYITFNYNISLDTGYYTSFFPENMVGLGVQFPNGNLNFGMADTTPTIRSTNITSATSGVGSINVRYDVGALNNKKITPMLLKGSYDKQISYSAYGVQPIELCKIGDYQDYIYKDNGSWYLHKEIGKVVLDGSESWSYQSNVNSYYTQKNDFIRLNNYTNAIRSNYYVSGVGQGATDDYYITGYSSSSYPGQNWIYIRNVDMANASAFKTWLSTHNTIVYYVLATPTNTEITDTNLIEQLESLSS